MYPLQPVPTLVRIASILMAHPEFPIPIHPMTMQSMHPFPSKQAQRTNAYQQRRGGTFSRIADFSPVPTRSGDVARVSWPIAKGREGKAALSLSLPSSLTVTSFLRSDTMFRCTHSRTCTHTRWPRLERERGQRGSRLHGMSAAMGKFRI